jgi:hypothetical protein
MGRPALVTGYLSSALMLLTVVRTEVGSPWPLVRVSSMAVAASRHGGGQVLAGGQADELHPLGGLCRVWLVLSTDWASEFEIVIELPLGPTGNWAQA